MALYRMKVKLLLLAALLLVGGIAAGAWMQAPDDAANQSVLSYRAGDVLTYEMGAPDGGRVEVQMRVYAPRWLPTANGTLAWGLPTVSELRTPDYVVADAFAVDLRQGGLLVSLDECLIDPTYACDGDVSYITWQQCPLGEWWSSITRKHLADGVVSITDPSRGSTWIYTITPLGGQRYEVAPQPGGPGFPMCAQPSTLVIDARRGVIDAASGPDGLTLRLVEFEKGDGPEYRVERLPSAASRFLAPDRARAGPFPVGAEAMGPAQWLLGEAWRTTVLESEEVRAFLAREPEAFLIRVEASETSSESGLLVPTTTTWEFDLLGLGREGIAIHSTQSFLGPVPVYEVVVQPLKVPEDVPDVYWPPAAQGADIMRFHASVGALGLGPAVPGLPPSFGVFFDGSAAVYSYTAHTSVDRFDSGVAAGWTSREYVVMNGELGRVTDAYVDVAKLKALIAAANSGGA